MENFEDQLFPEAFQQWDLARLYQDLAKVRNLSSSRESHLTPVEKAILRGLLCGKARKQIAAELHWTVGALGVELSNGIYRYVETLTNREPNSLKNWRDIASWLETAGYKEVKQKVQDWEETPDISSFYGREAELEQLNLSIVQQKSRLVLLIGMGGIGKTALAAKFARQMQSEFDYIIWRTLKYEPSLQELLAGLLEAFPTDNQTIPTSVNGKVSRLLEYLHQHRCLIVLDSLESILCHDNLAGFYQEQYKNYSQLIRRAAEESHQSCLLLASQDELAELDLIQGNKFNLMKLEGLGEAARHILAEKGLSDSQYWRELIERYKGNPLALKLVSTTIKDLFGGRVSNFLGQGTEFGLIIPIFFKELLRQQFGYLSELQRQIMCILAVNRQPINVAQLQAQLGERVYLAELTEALNSLKRRSLIEVISETDQTSFTLQPMIMKYVIREHQAACEQVAATIK